MQTVLDSNPTVPEAQSRRDFLKSLAPLALVPLVAGAAIPTIALATDAAPIALESPVEMPPPNVVVYTDGFGPAERAQAVRRWYWRFDILIQLGEKMQVFLEAAHVLPPEQVDGMRMLALEWEILDKLNALTCQMETVEFDDDYKLITGQRSYLWCLKYDIQTGTGMNPAELQLEIDAIRRDDPTAADMLQALLNARMGVN